MKLPRRLPSFGLGAVLLLLGSGTAEAELGNCSISTTPVAFGTYNVFDAGPLDSTGNIHITCTGKLPAVSVWLSKGSGPSTTQRQMVYWHPTLGQSQLDYNLYLDAAHTQVWGDPDPYCFSTSDKIPFAELSLDIYGRVRQEQDVPAGSYTDTVTVSINF